MSTFPGQRPSLTATWAPCLALGFVVALVATEARAQAPFVSESIPGARAWASAGWDPTWVVTAGIGKSVRVLGEREVELNASVTVPPLIAPSLDGAKAELGARARIVASGRLALVVAASTSLAWASDPTGEKLAWGLGLALQPGWYAGRWSLLLDAGWRLGLATRMWHSDAVRDTFADRYPGASGGPHEGWYSLPSSRVRFGALAGLRLGDSYALFGGGGWEHTPQAQGIEANPSIGQLPFYVTLGGEYRW